eukprot:10895020-Lingulodinium_polyedra.AAC.1
MSNGAGAAFAAISLNAEMSAGGRTPGAAPATKPPRRPQPPWQTSPAANELTEQDEHGPQEEPNHENRDRPNNRSPAGPGR